MDMNGLDFDLVVVGGGPGGAAVATFVALRGHRVLLLEREHFPRYSIGESLLPGTVHGVCRLLGVREEIEQANFVRKYGGTWRWGREAALWSFFFSENEELHKQNFDYAFQVERARFDEILLQNARRKGVDVREGHEVLDVLQEGGRTSGVRFVDEAGETHQARARFVADASGHRSRMARVLQQNLIEARALHLKRVVEILLVQLLVLAEEERPQSRFAPPSPSASVLAHEVRLLDLLAHTQQPADPMNGAGQQRLADRIAWEMLPLEQQNPVATQGYERRNGRPAGTAADDDEIEVQPIHVHRSLPAP